MTVWTDLIEAYRQVGDVSDEMKVATLAQWIVESGRGTSRLAKEHLNFGGLKYRARMAGYAEPVDYQGGDGDLTTYCRFSSVEKFFVGYRHFVDSGPYDGWRSYDDDAQGYVRHLAKMGYAADRSYVSKVVAVMEEARHLLGLPEDVGAGRRGGPGPAASRKICIDPGHGMSNATRGVYDPGASHREGETWYHEATIALQYGLALKDELRARGVKVYMTRDDASDDAPVGQRAGNARNSDCDVFLSLHLNQSSDGSGGAHGTEVLFRDDVDEELAVRLRDAVVEAAGTKARPCKKRTDLAVLKFDGPAALVELGFIANDGDRTKLLNTQVRAAVCEAMADAILT